MSIIPDMRWIQALHKDYTMTEKVMGHLILKHNNGSRARFSAYG